jgi:hypothetical protein
MNKSEQINELAAALAKAQSGMKAAIKDSSNPFFKSNYADLAAVWDACKSQLAANGLAISQHPATDEHGNILVETALIHSSGQWMSSTLAMKPVKNDPQAFGSAITYARRYALAAVVGVVTEDDDGNHASGRADGKPSHAEVAKAAEPPKQPTAKERVFKIIEERIGEKVAADNAAKWKPIIAATGVKVSTKMTDDEAEKVLFVLETEAAA